MDPKTDVNIWSLSFSYVNVLWVCIMPRGSMSFSDHSVGQAAHASAQSRSYHRSRHRIISNKVNKDTSDRWSRAP